MKPEYFHHANQPENVIFVSFGQAGIEHPVYSNDEESVIVDLMQYVGVRSHDEVVIELNHQFDPS